MDAARLQKMAVNAIRIAKDAERLENNGRSISDEIVGAVAGALLRAALSSDAPQGVREALGK